MCNIWNALVGKYYLVIGLLFRLFSDKILYRQPVSLFMLDEKIKWNQQIIIEWRRKQVLGVNFRNHTNDMRKIDRHSTRKTSKIISYTHKPHFVVSGACSFVFPLSLIFIERAWKRMAQILPVNIDESFCFDDWRWKTPALSLCCYFCSLNRFVNIKSAK